MTKQTILITGATSGIGRDAAVYLASRGHRVFACGRNERALAELRAEDGITALALDVTSPASIAAAKAEVDRLTDGAGVDVLINNAGYGLMGPLEMLSDDDVRAQFETNVFGLLAVTRAFLPAMRERRSGRILNVSSVGGRITFPLGGAYHATKYAVEAMSDALRMEVRQFGIEVVLIEPGYIKTGFTSTSVSLLERYKDGGSPYAAVLAQADGIEGKLERFAAEPRAVSRAIERAITSRRPRARYVAPWINAFGPWFRQWMPTRLLDWVLRRATGLTPRALPAPHAVLPSGLSVSGPSAGSA
jgi:NAD(P)-dependent dehydrogenase (short-subunit alcohol dehydrogenase family)